MEESRVIKEKERIAWGIFTFGILIFYFIVSFVSWVILKILEEWGLVWKNAYGFFESEQNFKGLITTINYIHLPINLYRILYESHQITTIVITVIFVLILWWRINNE